MVWHDDHIPNAASQKTREWLNLLIFVGDYEAFDGRKCTLPETIIYELKINGWQMRFPVRVDYFQG